MAIRTHYDELHVTQDAPRVVIRAAYRVLSQQYHPDRMKQDDGGERMRAINSAWAVLSDEEARAAYDKQVNAIFEGNVSAYTQHVQKQAEQEAGERVDAQRSAVIPWAWLVAMVVFLAILTSLFSRQAS